jgi:hypothetical protein
MARRGKRRPLACHDCDIDTSHWHYYMLHDEVWQQATKATTGRVRFLCLDCLEARLGRPLVEADFVLTPPEMAARFDGEGHEPLPPAQRQWELDTWRAYGREQLAPGVAR